MTSFAQPNLVCAMCGASFYSASPREFHGDPCSRCEHGTLIFSKPYSLSRFTDRTSIGEAIDKLEQHANGGPA